MDPVSSPSESEGLEIRSFHVVFRLERRLHRIDRWRLPYPHGVPIAAIGHATVLLLAVVVLRGSPGIGAVIGALPAPLVYVLGPAAGAAALCRLRVDGRPAHRHLTARLAHHAHRRWRYLRADSGLVAGVTALAHAPERPGYPRARITGPARVTLRGPARAHARARALRVRGRAGGALRRPLVVRLRAGQRLVIRESQ
jgi:hypothetical protein